MLGPGKQYENHGSRYHGLLCWQAAETDDTHYEYIQLELNKTKSKYVPITLKKNQRLKRFFGTRPWSVSLFYINVFQYTWLSKWVCGISFSLM